MIDFRLVALLAAFLRLDCGARRKIEWLDKPLLRARLRTLAGENELDIRFPDRLHCLSCQRKAPVQPRKSAMYKRLDKEQ